MKEWHFNVLFFVGVGGAIFVLLGPEFGLNTGQNPTAVTGVGAILTYVLTQRKTFTKKDSAKKDSIREKKEGDDDGGP